MPELVLFVCSYGRDLLRVKRLVESVERHNLDGLQVCVAVPREHLQPFWNCLGQGRVAWIAQEDVYGASPSAQRHPFGSVSGSDMQQVVKTEAWRLGLAENLLVLDSDCVFLRNFGQADFVDTGGTPITVMEPAESVRALAECIGRAEIWQDWLRTSARARYLLGCTGSATHSFGGAPFVWSARVWRDLQERVLEPSGRTMLDAIREVGSELMIYGEAALALGSIPLRPSAQLFKLYLFEAQYWRDRADGVAESDLARSYLGVVYQSNWQEELDHPDFRRPFASRVRRVLRRTASHTVWMVRKRLGLGRSALLRCSPTLP